MTKDKSNRIAIIGLLLTSIGIIAPIIYSKIQDNSTIELQQNNLTTILNKPKDIDSLQILYKKIPIDNLSKLNLTVFNNSNTSVIKNDFIKPIKIRFSENTKIITYEIEETKPQGITSTVKVDSLQKSLNLSFDLLNPNDKINLAIIFTGELKQPIITGRVKGIKEIEYNIASESRDNYKVPFVVLFFVVLAQSFLFVVNRERKSSIISRNRFLKSKDEVIKKYSSDSTHLIYSFFSHYGVKSISEMILKIKLINENDEIKDKPSAIENLIVKELEDNISINTKARIVGATISLVGIIYLVIWVLNNESIKNGIQQWL